MERAPQVFSPCAAGADARVRLGKLVGMLGSSHAGERSNALAAIDELLKRAGLSWTWLADLAARGERSDGNREKLFARLVADRLRRGLLYAFVLQGEEAKFVRELVARCDTDLKDAQPETGAPLVAGTSAKAIRRAIEIADRAVRHGKGPG